jgi:hypothetical protein
VRFLPVNSPDLNPIEMMWSKVKALLRKAEARSHPDLLVAIASALNAVTPNDALGWYLLRLQFYLKCSKAFCAYVREIVVLRFERDTPSSWTTSAT